MMYFQRIPYVFLIALTLATALSGCSSPPPPPDCITSENRELLVRWGDIEEDKTVTGFAVHSNASMVSFAQKSLEAPMKETELGVMDGVVYCETVKLIRTTFLEVQALHAPGNVSRFIEISNPPQGLYLRAVWNPKYETFGSKEFRAIFDTLQSFRERVRD